MYLRACDGKESVKRLGLAFGLAFASGCFLHHGALAAEADPSQIEQNLEQRKELRSPAARSEDLPVLSTPGGGAADWLKALLVGTVAVPGVPTAITDWIPTALVLLVVCLAVVWIPVVRSRLGLSIYAIGSDSLAAFRSGVSVSRTRIAAYALGGLFAAMGGLVLTMSTGIGAPIPGPYLLASVAAVVLGGVTLGGGQGGLVGPIVAVFILRLVRSDLTFLSVDPNAATIVEGTIMVIVVMLGALVALRSRST